MQSNYNGNQIRLRYFYMVLFLYIAYYTAAAMTTEEMEEVTGTAMMIDSVTATKSTEFVCNFKTTQNIYLMNNNINPLYLISIE